MDYGNDASPLKPSWGTLSGIFFAITIANFLLDWWFPPFISSILPFIPPLSFFLSSLQRMHEHVRLILWKHITSSDQSWSHIARHEWVTVRTQIIRPHASTLELPLLIRSGSFFFSFVWSSEGVSFRCAQLRTLVLCIRLWVCHVPEPATSPLLPLPLLNVRKTIIVPHKITNKSSRFTPPFIPTPTPSKHPLTK